MAAIAYEVMLTRYFAIASWSEYGYWVISIAMVGLAFSGVLLSLFQGVASRHCNLLFPILPLLLMVAAVVGYHFTAINPFNPLELQNPVLWKTQLWNIGAYYLALFPFFFLSGLFLGLTFVVYQSEVSFLYGADLVGAGCGAVLVLGLMFFVHPFYLVCLVPGILAVAAFACAPAKAPVSGWLIRIAAVGLFAACEVWIWANNQARFFEYKSIYPVLHVADNRILNEIRSPRGYYLVLDNFTERRDLPVSNNTGMLGLEGPPAAPGLYKDGNRLTSLAGSGDCDLSYVDGALSTFPFTIRPRPEVLLVGASGGFRLLEAQHLGSKRITILESDGVLHKLSFKGQGDRPAEDVEFLHESPQSYLARTADRFDVIDIADEYLYEGPANKYSFTREAISRYLEGLNPAGILSIPVSIRELAVYAVKLVETVRAGLAASGIENPAAHIIVYRSEWSARILVSPSPFTAEDIASLREFCSDLSFDTSYFPGMDPATVEVWNDLPPISFEGETTASFSSEASDALRDDILALLGPEGESFLSSSFFNLSPSTDDRPFLQYIFRPTRLGDLLAKMELIPHEEIGFLTSMAVLAQAAAFGLLVLVLPVARLRALRGSGLRVLKGSIYFACLGLGFLFIEIALIDKCAYLLDDAVSAFAVVLSGMLIFSGLGSMAAGRFRGNPRRGLTIAVAVIVCSLAVYVFFMDTLILALIDQPFAVKCVAILALIAPVSFALGMPFPLGMSSLSGPMVAFLPISWAINGAFSVISSPLANVLAVLYGYTLVFSVAMLVYPLAWATLPKGKKGQEHESPAA